MAQKSTVRNTEAPDMPDIDPNTTPDDVESAGAPEEQGGTVVHYVGLADEVHFTAEDLRRVDPAYEGKALSFNADNLFKIQGTFSEELEKYFAGDGSFEVNPREGSRRVADRIARIR